MSRRKGLAEAELEADHTDLRLAFLDGLLSPKDKRAKEAQAAVHRWLAEFFNEFFEDIEFRVDIIDIQIIEALGALFQRGRVLKIGKRKGQDTEARHRDIVFRMVEYRLAHRDSYYEEMIADAVANLGVTRATAVRIWSNRKLRLDAYGMVYARLTSRKPRVTAGFKELRDLPPEYWSEYQRLQSENRPYRTSRTKSQK
jgi:hypothetical protein